MKISDETENNSKVKFLDIRTPSKKGIERNNCEIKKSQPRSVYMILRTIVSFSVISKCINAIFVAE